MPHIQYSVTVGPGVDIVTGSEFADTVSRALADARGWRKYGYEFERRSRGNGALDIRLETGTTAASLCGFSGFSCARSVANDIIVSLSNWLGGSKSEMSLDRYRTYVVNHEVGHILGLQHQQCPIAECRRRGLPVCPASIMQQMTRGPGAIAPCVETEWPLDPSWRIDDPSRTTALSGWAVLLAVIVILAVVLLAVVLTVKNAHALRAAARSGFISAPRSGRAQP